MSVKYLITIGEPNEVKNGIFADTLEEAVEFVNKVIATIQPNNENYGKYIYIKEYVENDNNYIPKNDLFIERKKLSNTLL
jgi:hypothetical protein